jgi:photosynthetic reaction center cytochrome c subunit
VPQFTRLMQAMTAWVAPEQGCAYCHTEGEALSSDSAYTKVVARRMLQMNLAINASWTDHVGGTGVTCFTCHRGNNVPQYGWYLDPESAGPGKALGNRAGQNRPAPEVAYASLPADPFSTYLDGKDNIRVLTQNPLPLKGQTGASIVAIEQTYGLMMHISDSLGVNCTYCHNSRAFGAWEESSPVRTTAWYGIRLARDLNAEYVSALASVVPEKRLGPLGDIKKVNCMTCHQGAPKPLNGVSMLADYPELSASR